MDAGFLCLPAFERDVYLAPLRATPAWPPLIARAAAAQAAVAEVFSAHRGAALLGL